MAEIAWTRFLDKTATSARELQHEWRELVEHLQHAGPFAAKSVCPWIKLARFGNARTQKDALRHDANILQITGVEGDYDAEQMQPEEAIALLERAQVRAIVYTSPSHTPAAPRWRVLAPLSNPASPSARSALLARVNGALGGVLTPESFTLSQSYYYGRVQGQDDYRVLVTFDDPDDGTPVDELDELDDIAVGRPVRDHANHAQAPANAIAARVEQLGRRLRTGDNRRELLKSYIGDRSNRGLSADEIRALLDDIVTRFFDPEDPVDWSNINRLITDITDADTAEREKVEATVGEFIQRVVGQVAAPAAELAPLDLSDLAKHQAEPIAFLVDKWLPAKAVTVLTAHGGVGKSTMSLQLAVCIATGTPWFGIATQRAHVLLVSCEDSKQAIHWRLAHVCKAMGVDMASLQGHLTIYDLTEQDCVMWAKGHATQRMQWLAGVCETHGARCVILDNASDTYADNENDRSAVRGFVRTLARIAIHIEGSVLLLAHVDKASARGVVESSDSYSGSTAWNNSARSRWAMARNKDRTIQISNEKNNYAARQEPFTVQYDAVQHVFSSIEEFNAGPADELIENRMRLEIMRAIERANKSQDKISRSRRANNNALKVCRSYDLPKFPDEQFWTVLEKLILWKFIEIQEYRKSDRTQGQHLVLTDEGRQRVATGSGAPPKWRQE